MQLGIKIRFSEKYNLGFSIYILGQTFHSISQYFQTNT